MCDCADRSSQSSPWRRLSERADAPEGPAEKFAPVRLRLDTEPIQEAEGAVVGGGGGRGRGRGSNNFSPHLGESCGC